MMMANAETYDSEDKAIVVEIGYCSGIPFKPEIVKILIVWFHCIDKRGHPGLQ